MSCAATLSNYLINQIMLNITDQNDWTGPEATYVALFTSNPNPDGSGTEVTTSGSAYSRQAITWSAVGGGNTANNSADITFPAATSNWGTVTYAAIFDAVTSGNLLCFAPLTSSTAVNTGNIFKFPATDLTLSFQ